MTEWIMTCYDGRTYTLPTPIAWRLDYGLGDPCDGFWVKTLWTAGREDLLADGVRMTVRDQGEIVFTGIVDECVCQWSERGCTAEITGRGLQGLLLDNQAEGADYGLATLEEVMRQYVTPFGISLAQPVSLPGVAGFSVLSGSSCWKVLYQFARYYGGVTPRFDRQGRLHLEPWQDGTPVVLDETAPVTRTALRETRYGVLSQVTVKDLSGWTEQTEVNQVFLDRGGCARRVICLPRKVGHQARRYQARFQLDRSAAGLRRVELSLAIPFAAWPGDLVQLTRAGWSRNGLYRVQECSVEMDERGCQTHLVLGDPDAVL